MKKCKMTANGKHFWEEVEDKTFECMYIFKECHFCGLKKDWKEIPYKETKEDKCNHEYKKGISGFFERFTSGYGQECIKCGHDSSGGVPCMYP